MRSRPLVGRWCGLLLIGVAASSSACDTSNPVALAPEPVVLMGRVSSVAVSGAAALESSSSLEGIEVSVEGSTVATTTNASGSFRLEVEAGDDRVVLRFRRGSLDARIELEGVTPGTLIRIDISLNDDGGTVTRRDDGEHEDFEGTATFVSLTGVAPARTLRVALTHEGGSVDVDIVEAETVFEADGDVLTFAALLGALSDSTVTVEIEGDGATEGDVTVATSVKVETDDDDDGDDHGDDDGDQLVEFEGFAALVSMSGTAPSRTARVELTSGERVRLVDIIEGETAFEAEGDILSFAALVVALSDSLQTVRIEGDGALDGAVTAATSVKVETDDDDDDHEGPRDGDHGLAEFRGLATLVSVSGTAPHRTLRARVTDHEDVCFADLVEGETEFDDSGDFHSVGAVLSALSSVGVIRLEGRGAADDDGTIVATTARAELD